MTYGEFLKQYANTPIEDRQKIIDAGLSGKFTLLEIYEQLQRLEDYLWPIKTQQENLISIAEKQWTTRSMSQT